MLGHSGFGVKRLGLPRMTLPCVGAPPSEALAVMLPIQWDSSQLSSCPPVALTPTKAHTHLLTFVQIPSCPPLHCLRPSPGSPPPTCPNVPGELFLENCKAPGK